AVNKTMNAPVTGEIQPNRPALNYKWFFDEWIYSAGQPEYKVNYIYDEQKKQIRLIASQIQRLDTSSVFKTPVEVDIITKDSVYRQNLVIPYESEVYKYDMHTKSD